MRTRHILTGMTQTMSHTAETLTIKADDGAYLGAITLDVSDDIIDLAVADEDGATVILGLSTAEAMQLIAELSVKVAQVRAAR